MTQKEKLIRLTQFAVMVKSIARSIEYDCKDYDETWALTYAKQLTEKADEMISMLKK